MAHDVFISYSSPDKSIADAVCAYLEGQQIRCWIAPRDILPGLPYGEALIEAISASAIFVLIFSATANNSPQVMREVERAVSKDIPILPFRIENVAPSKSMEYFLSSPHWLDALTPPVEQHFERLSETAQILLERAGQKNTEQPMRETERAATPSVKAATAALPQAQSRPQRHPLHKLPMWGWMAGGVGVLALCLGLIAGGYSLLASLPTRTPTASTLIALATTISTTTPARTQTPGSLGRIAFVSESDGNDEIYVMNANGSNVTRLTNNTAKDDYPAWSPDGQQMAFTTARDGNDEIYRMNADGSDLARLTNNTANDYYPAWSPDGQQIAFSSDRDGKSEIYVMNTDGSGVTRLTNNLEDDYFPAWSPDGQQIAFSSNRTGNDEIYVMHADGSGLTRLTNNIATNYFPAWSPDGKRITFTTNRDGNYEVYVMNADGTGVTNLTNNSAYDYHPVWSPDGQRIAFESDRDHNFEIYAMNADGSAMTNLTNNSADDHQPAWSP